jgi:NADPH:quinone reductase-like Zn-dependent oxidoreductase
LLFFETQKNHEYLKSIGADVTIDYRETGVLAQIKDAVKQGGLQFALDTVNEKGSTDIVVDCITTNGHVITTLPPSAETTNRRAGVKVEFVLVYTLITDHDFTFGKVLPVKAVPSDHTAAQEFATNETIKLLEGWQEGKGAPHYKGQKLRIGRGLENIHEGLEYMEAGKVSAEKLVYTL